MAYAGSTANSPSANLHPRTFPRLDALNATLTGKVLLAVCASVFVAACAHISVRLPFTPVPLTFSDFAVLLVGLALGPATGFAALALYLVEGACGLPVFNPGPGGVVQLLGHTGGYLFAYPFAAAIAGLARAFRSGTSRLLAGLIGSAIASTLIMVSGTLWLSLMFVHNLRTAFVLGAAPFLYGQVVKVVAAAGIFASLQRRRRA
jgi:biotin transport system substrate-specific component